MDAQTAGEDSFLVYNYETAFSIFMGAAVFLCRENPAVRYPDILHLFLLLMLLNLAAGLSLKLWPTKIGLSALFIMSNCAAITGIMACSGGTESNLWVLYLLPIYTACLLLDGRQALWITAGAAGFNAAFVWLQSPQFGALEAFGLAVKTGILIFCAGTTWKMVAQKRDRSRDLEAARGLLESLTKTLDAQKEKLEGGTATEQWSLLGLGLAHDLRNSFTAIAGFTELMEKEDSIEDLKAEARAIGRSIRAAEGHLAAFVRIGAENAVPLVPDDINEILRSASPLFEGLLKPARIRLELRLHEPLPRIAASRGHLQRLFVNLVSNAAHAVPTDGTLTITTDKIARKGQYQIRVAVEDTGPGLPETVLSRLFHPFATTRLAQGGTGLGLYNCSEIARQHNGWLHAQNRAEGGARFDLFLPSQQATQ